ncbi:MULTISPECIES: TonB-dependent receptor [unclassified Pedobacter]|uniref:TonB-dependent receptor n=1 Tax=unclassified Pedobacter TaxID=2628915 RepID=UPI001E4D6FE8|nr:MULTISPECIES: TonB-dependent receptor [unclassified Pedobacter]
MKSKFSLFVLFSLFIALVFAFKVEDDPLLKLLNQLEKFTSNYANEKVYVQSDKPYYAVGDDIWLKAYILNTKTQAPSKISKILYVELIDENNEIKNQIKLNANEGVAWGDFKLPDSLREGNYRLRAYTNYMRNFSSDFFYDKVIKIGNSWSNNVFINTVFDFTSANKVNATVQFRDKNDLPYANKNVLFDVLVDEKSYTKERSKTDADGKVTISFTSPDIRNKIAKIVSTINLSGQEIVKKVIPVSSFSNLADVQFFPEGGYLVEDQPQKIAFKATGSNGLGIYVKGKILDGNAVIGNFNTDFAGMGSFSTNLKSGKKYSAVINFGDGSEKTFDLPTVKPSGYTLTVNNNDASKIAIRLTASSDLINTDDVRIVGQQDGNLRFAFNAKLSSQTIIKSIPIEKFTTGIAQITVFSAQNEPIAERMIFVKNNASDLKLQVNKDKISQNAGASSEINLTDNDENLTGSFSISVTNTDVVKPDLDNESNILTSLLLTGDLSGYVEKPNHYFLNADEQTRKELDNLMLTQGWRRYSWIDILQDKVLPLTFQVEKSSYISGSVVRGKNPIKGSAVFLLSKNGGDIVRDTITDVHGKFKFDNLAFTDSTQFLVQATPLKKGSFLELIIDSADNQKVTKNKSIADVEINVNTSLMQYIKASDRYFGELTRLGLLEKSIKLKDVDIRSSRIKKAVQYSANYNGPGNADQVLTADDLPPYYGTLSQSLGNMLRGVRIIRGRAYRLPGMPDLANDDGKGSLDVYYNGTRLPDGNLDMINPMDVQCVELLTSISRMVIYGPMRAPGIIIITSKRGLGYSAKQVKDLSFDHLTIKPKGIYPSRTFYVPKYNVSNTTAEEARSTIYWNPNIVPNNEGFAKVTFKNANAKGNYRVVIEGFNKVGQPARETFSYRVSNDL